MGMFKKPFSFKGRIGRTEYIISYIFFIAFYFLVGPTVETSDMGSLLGLLMIPILWFLLAQGAKRCHDTGRSGWWQLIPMFWIILLIAKGEIKANKYGDVLDYKLKKELSPKS